ncbi:hypothetical protein P0W64_02510 [Tsukamurella sp. 8F]|uniref:hypothetical protein n=1 Tax=unclassified Tsukamurella TaxID=2633480 RepID=UPI0023B95DE1|nr:MULTISPECIES: hypothetical protein [unclassified Tsukamurella]MDF0528679.1 hypothetical protein [Tsukamurella sp. 8J]MDF0585641.1 hypothetical protein [Tsukamurella sp. 8F]
MPTRALPLARRTVAAVAGLGAAAMIAAPIAAAAPAPTPKPRPAAGKLDLARKVPGTSCTVGQVRAAANHLSPGLYDRLQDAAGGPKTFSDIVAADPGSRQLQLVGLVLRGSVTGLQMVGQEADIESTLRQAYKDCGKYPAQAVKAPAKR